MRQAKGIKVVRKKNRVSELNVRAQEAVKLSKDLKEIVFRFAKRHTDVNGNMKPEMMLCISAALKTVYVNHWSIVLKKHTGAEVLEFMNQEALEVAEQVISRRGGR